MIQKSIKMCVQKATIYTLQYVQHPLLHVYTFSTPLLLNRTLIRTLSYTYFYIYSTKAYLSPTPPH